MPVTRAGRAVTKEVVGTFENIQELRDSVPQAGTFSVAGYYAAGDGGGGPLRVWKTGAIGTYVDNGGSIIVPTGGDGSGAWVWEYSGAVSAKWFGIGFGSDDAIKLKALLDSNTSLALDISDTTIILNSVVTSAINSITIKGDINTIIDCSGGGQLDLDGGLESLPALAAHITKGSNLVTFLTAHGLSHGDVFCVWNPIGNSFLQDPTAVTSFDGDWMRVSAINSTSQVKIYGSPPDDYTAGDMECYKMLGGYISIEDVSFIPSPLQNIALRVSGHQGVRYKNVAASIGAPQTALTVIKSYDVDIQTLRSTANLSDAYAISIVNCKKVRIHGSSTYSTRHCVTLGGTVGAGAVPTRSVIVVDSILTNDSTAGIGAADIHGNCDDITYSNCTMDVAANPAGRNVRFNNCMIISRPSDGNAIFASGVVGGYTIFSNCVIKLIGTGGGGAFGVFGFTPDFTKYNWKLIINDCTIEAPGVSISDIVRVQFGDDRVPNRVDVEINNITVNANSVLSVYRPNSTNFNVAAYASLSLSGYKGKAANNYISASATIGTRAGMPLRLPKQMALHTINTALTSAVVKYLAVITFKTAYPRPPYIRQSMQRLNSENLNLQGLAQPLMLYTERARTLDTNTALVRTDLTAFTLTYTDVIITVESWIDDIVG